MKVLVLPGDGIGEEITAATLEVLEAVGKKTDIIFEFDHEVVGLKSYEINGTTCPDIVVEKALASDGVLLGPISHLDYTKFATGGINVSGVFRSKLDLYANVRPAHTWRNVPNKAGEDFDLVIMREATEGFYPDRNMFAGCGEFMTDPNTALSVRKITAHASERIARRAFELARTRRKKVTAVHKANTFILTDGLFLREVRNVADEFPDVEFEEKIVDAMAALLIRHPSSFDVICATNFHADILSDLASELSGSLGLAGSINAGENLCAAQAQHGSAPDIAGQGKANPTSLILSGAMLLDWYGQKSQDLRYSKACQIINHAVATCLESAEVRTADLGGPSSTGQFSQHIVNEINAL